MQNPLTPSRLLAGVCLAFAVALFGGVDAPARPADPAPAGPPEIGSGDAVVGDTSATFATWGDGKAVIVWSDVPATRTNTGRSDGAAQYRGWHRSPDGRRVRWQCLTRDGKTGTVTINGRDYDLGKGGVFLVTVEGDATRVKQLKRDTANLQDEDLAGTLAGWRKDDAEVRGFFAGDGGPRR